jgi:hypothetical protein
MNINKIIKTLKKHVDDEVKVHKKVFNTKDKNIQQLVKMHIKDTVELHKKFWSELKKSSKSK